ncbi:hypothetical protein GYMLUDRAFT_716634 [Collybiopsis luxurians FD-317 M1]|nr:hypothetical protein GYMLUDRAFT_716634 [Collybiopsis luxurians FD-317 M1]
MVYLNSLAELQTLILKLSLPGFISMRTPPKNHSISGGADVPASTVSKVVDELDLIFFELFNRSAHPQIFLEIETTSTTSPVEPLPKRIHPSSMNVRLIPSPKE